MFFVKFLRICLLHFLLYGFMISFGENADSTGYDTGFFGTCNYLQYLDLAISRSDVSDNLRLLLAAEKPNDYHAYPINQSSMILRDDYFKREYKTVLFVHGFTRSTTNVLTETIASAYKIAGGYNIIILDTNDYTWTNYFWAIRATRQIGNRLGVVLNRLSRRGLNISNFTLIGHSLGAHISGFAGKTFRNRTGYRLPFIVGLDPAGPCFRNVSRRDRLASTDAQFVEVIHTNGVGLGLLNAVGDQDIYFNGGRIQNTYLGKKCRTVCSHISAVSIWAASVVDNQKFLGIQCKNLGELDSGDCFGGVRNTTYLGPAAVRNRSGIFLVTFLKLSPNCAFYGEDYYSRASKWFGYNHGSF